MRPARASSRPAQILIAVTIAGAALAFCSSAFAQTITGTRLSQRLRAHDVVLSDARVSGNFTLPVRPSHAFTCVKCQFDGDVIAVRARILQRIDLAGSTIAGKFDLAHAILNRGLDASDVRFDGIVDLRGAHIHHAADFSGSSFAAPALFGEATKRYSFYGSADFSLASFEQLASFEKVHFGSASDFTLASFHADAVFSDGHTRGSAFFVRTIFDGATDFSSYRFDGPAHFGGAQFRSAANFTQTLFRQRTSFLAADFQQTADFSQATFNLPTSFRRAHFDAGASFFSAEFLDDDLPGVMDSFEQMHSSGTVDFSLADMERPTNFAESSAASVAFASTSLPSAGVVVYDISWKSVQMSVGDALTAVRENSGHDREGLLALLESSAKSQNDLSTANAAHYQRQVLLAGQYTWPVRAADVVFYRWAAGYFVRPLNPIAVLLLLAAVATLSRIAWEATAIERRRGLRSVGERIGPSARRAIHTARRFPDRYVQSLALVIPRRGDQPAVATNRIESFTYRALIACALIGFANSNPTLREMFNALL